VKRGRQGADREGRSAFPEVHGGLVWKGRPGGPQHGVAAGAGPGPTSPFEYVNDPSAGSPTETLLRLLLPLNDQV
jgi:hypothetical protein